MRCGVFPQELKWDFVISSIIGTAIIFALGLFVFDRLESTVLKEI